VTKPSQFGRRTFLKSSAALGVWGAAMFTTGAYGQAPTPRAPQPFRVSVPPAEIERIRARVRTARLPKPMGDDSWETGMSVRWLRQLQQYWVESFDWSRAEERLNAFPQYMARVDDVDLHFYHITGEGPNPLPVVMTHGWPGSVVEFLHLIEPLTQPSRHGGRPEDAFTLVLPSLPGFGWSSMPSRPIQGRSTARLWNRLMVDVLGYQRYGAQGGDIGAGVSVELAYQFPERLVGVHLNLLPWPQPTANDKTPEVEAWLVEGQRYMEREFDYLRMQTNKPLMPAVALVDSPLGTAAWIAEKFWAWSDHNGNLDSIISKDTLLTNVMLYLVGPGGIDGSFWFYRAIRDELRWNFHRGFVRVPTASARFPREYPMGRIPETLARRAYNLKRVTDMPRGGHFAALEQPQLLREDITAFFRTLR
jgi:pimeloyl-ACP methyl ester carboxylesterase